MSQKKRTVFQNLTNAMMHGFDQDVENKYKAISSYKLDPDKVIHRTTDKVTHDITKEKLKQDKYLANQWISSSTSLNKSSSMVYSNLHLMYRDADIMDNYPEIGAALDIYAEESCTLDNKGKVLTVHSSSERIRKVLEDLFVNRLDIHTMLPMWTRTTCKYGNAFILLNIDGDKGIIGGRQLPTYEINRVEGGLYNPHMTVNNNNKHPMDTEFTWIGDNGSMAYKNWQVAHFRLLTDSTHLPYGTSVLNKARRHFKMLTMMEDMMLIYRLERSIERRVFKIFVGNIDDADIPAYVQEIANTFKRTTIVDPETGQVDLRKASLDVSQDIFIPIKDINAPMPIDTLAPASNIDKIEDLKYMQNKLFAALRMSKEMLNFEDSTGDGKNLAMKDIRFARVINRIQQSMIMELTKIAMIHLYINGYTDDLTNFRISLNTPSTQAEILRIEEMQNKINLITSAISDPGNGIQIMSLTRALKQILGWSDEEILENLMEIRMEKALANELSNTGQIIKRTGVFDKIDGLYGEQGAEYIDTEGEMEDDTFGGGGGGFAGGGFSGDIGDDLGGDLEDGDLDGLENEMGDDNFNVTDNPQETLEDNVEDNPLKMETPKKSNKKLIVESKNRQNRMKKDAISVLKDYITEREGGVNAEVTPLIDKLFIKNEEINKLIENLNETTIK